MNGWALLGLILVAYGVFVAYVAYKKPVKIWDMAKIRLFRKMLGENGTRILFYIIAAVCVIIGITLIK
ncbi:MAG: hypothetical protein PHG48_01065 [Eubacteriales bacterium]|nr:hypothetical protein [Eubacteriales bacterium]